MGDHRGSVGTTRAERERYVSTIFDHLLDDIDFGVISQRDIADLRALRDRCQEVETGLSFGRRMVQGRLDIVMAEMERRVGGGDPSVSDLLGRLPELLSRHERSTGLPRPVRDTELPSFTDDLDDALDHILPAERLSHLAEVPGDKLVAAVEELRTFENRVSSKRHEMHRIIDDLQEEIVSRYRSGAASVDDLLH